MLIGFAAFWAIVGTLAFYKVVIQPRQWMKKHADGNYSPLRRAYINASKNIQQ